MVMVAQHLLQLPNGLQELVVIGYSYGACIAANLMEHVPQVRVAAVNCSDAARNEGIELRGSVSEQRSRAAALHAPCAAHG
jgi:pimeloyl-ACP methyl ester carboxylesterase